MQEHPEKRIFTIPNILSMFRFVLAFWFAWVYLHAQTVADYYFSAVLVVISGFTDVIDGQIARHFHMVTDLGKILDPVADKFTQGILALCLMSRYPLMRVLFVMFLLKETYMSIRGITVLKVSGVNRGALWFGKVNTVVLYGVMFFLIVLPNLEIHIVNVLILFCMAVMLFAWIMYAVTYHKIIKESKKK
ncbi:CDP-alcohol phosphatidyltransferase family protein [Hespellia stercorisuis]|uniref:CDP-diacylglycerol--glycerol-3-phosphate 3-phosphatidyltransferase n=1 Tax=Hespellia stercorisuis DSM 15480 TaxID=1121950 RepID=A0A1M6N4D2_9FIRM|nr:CDP-alcohol phosphatidyltransferase family protein [Hespellia stercorisuis]SHJ90538.1 CDP-diacylglycerol--glycerol-3-phosphate 3-phosphatidyltransferase [Hespellia stercorisuis DSM 15480]